MVNDFLGLSSHGPDPNDKLLLSVVREWCATFDAITDMVSVHDNDFTIMRCNKAFAEALGSKPSELVGSKCYEVLHGTDEPVDGCPHRECINSDAPVIREVVPTAGSDKIFQVSCSPFHGDDGGLLGTVHIARDISAIKAIEEEKELLLAELQEAMAKVKVLSGLLPICSYCKNIRDDDGYWREIESFIHKHSEAKFSHGICPDCLERVYREEGIASDD